MLNGVTAIALFQSLIFQFLFSGSADFRSNLALNQPAKQSSNDDSFGGAEVANDGSNRLTELSESVAGTSAVGTNQWWMVDFRSVYLLNTVVVTLPNDEC